MSGRGLTDAERVALADRARGYSLPLVLARGKPEPMRGILIDPEKKTVAEVEIADTLEAYYAALECSTVERVRLGPRHNLWVDKAGWFKSRPRFQMRSAGLAPVTIIGRGLLLDQRGADSVSCSLPLELVRQMITFERVAAQ